MKAWLKYILGFIVIVVIAGAGFAWWVYHKPHRNINDEIAVKVATNTLLDAFKQNEKTASAKYNDKILELSGIVKEASKNEAGNWVVNIENTTQTGSITVAFSALQDAIQPFDSITYKGICAGFFPEENNIVINEAVLLSRVKTDTTKTILVFSNSFYLSLSLLIFPLDGTIPSFKAAFVAYIASSILSFFSLSSTSVAAPTLRTATPPDNLARRS